MPLQGRSADDLPLAAYTTGVDPETEPAMEPAAPDPVVAALATPMFASGPFATPDSMPFDAGADGAPPAGKPSFRELVRNPRAHVRDPRLLLGGVIVIGLVLLAGSLIGGGVTPNPAGANASPSAPALALVTAAPAGDASVEFTGALTGTFALTGVTGTGRSAQAAIDSSWGDTLGDVLALGGSVSQGTRTTDAGFTLSWTVMIAGKAVQFESKAGECTVGMAVKPTTVSGSFVCHKVKSADGKYVVGASGTYRT